MVVLTVTRKDNKWKGVANDPFQNRTQNLKRSTKEEEKPTAHLGARY